MGSLSGVRNSAVHQDFTVYSMVRVKMLEGMVDMYELHIWCELP